MKVIVGAALIGVGSGVIVSGGVNVLPIFACVTTFVGIALMFWE